MLGATGMRASKTATVTSGPTTNIRRFVLRSAKCPPSALPGMPPRRMRADNSPPADESKCRSVATYWLNNCDVVK